MRLLQPMQPMRFMRNLERILCVSCSFVRNKQITGPTDFITMEQLYEFPVLIEETNEVITLFLNKEDMAEASQDSAFLQNLVTKEQEKKIDNIEVAEVKELNENIDTNNTASKMERCTAQLVMWSSRPFFLACVLLYGPLGYGFYILQQSVHYTSRNCHE